MKKLLTGLLIVAVMLLAVGCAQSTNPPTTYEPYTPATISNLGLPIIVGAVAVAPASMELDNLYAGVIVDTWTHSSNDPFIGHQKGEPLCIFIYNGQDQIVTFSATYLDIVGETAHRSSTDKTYYKAPLDARDWVTIQPSVIIAPKSVGRILLSLSIPLGASCPNKQWEFRIHIKDTGQTGEIHVAHNVRILITMK